MVLQETQDTHTHTHKIGSPAGIEPTPAALEGKVLTTGAPGMSLEQILRTHSVLAVTSVLIKSCRADVITPRDLIVQMRELQHKETASFYGHTAGRWELAEPG